MLALKMPKLTVGLILSVSLYGLTAGQFTQQTTSSITRGTYLYSLIRGSSFIKGGQMLNVSMSPPDNSQTNYTLHLLYFASDNQSPIVASDTIVQLCKILSALRDTYLLCVFPDISPLYPDQQVYQNSKIAVEPAGKLGGCQPQQNKDRLCYVIMADGKPLDFDAEYDIIIWYPQQRLNDHTLMYYPNPQPANFTMENETQMKISGTGFRPREFERGYKITLLNDRLWCSLKDSSTVNADELRNSDNALYCVIDKDRLQVFLDNFTKEENENQSVALQVAIQIGNWRKVAQVEYPLSPMVSSNSTRIRKLEPVIMSFHKQSSFRTGGSYLDVILFPGRRAIAKPMLNVLYVVEASKNQSDVQRYSKTCFYRSDVLSCRFPDLSQILPNFTSDLTNSSMLVQPCEYTNTRQSHICFYISDDIKNVSMPDSKYPSSFLNLKYYPDPVVQHVASSGNQLTVTGSGLDINRDLYEKYNISLLRNRLPCHLPKYEQRNNTEHGTTISCNFDDARLADLLEHIHGITRLKSRRAISVEVLVKNGNWHFASSINHKIDNDLMLVNTRRTNDNVPIAVGVPICLMAFIAIILVGVFAYVKYGNSPKIDKFVGYVFPVLPTWIRPIRQANTNDLKSVIQLLPEDMGATVARYFIDPARIHAGPLLGKGYFGIVCSGKYSSEKDMYRRKSRSSQFAEKPGEPVAIKFVNKLDGPDSAKDCFQEAIHMLSFSHENVLGAYGITSSNNCPALVLPMMEVGDLRRFLLSTQNDITDPMLFDFAKQIANGMLYLAKNKFIHRDLATRNCLLDTKRVVKVADFGLSVKADNVNEVYGFPEYRMKSLQKPLPCRWMAPESLQKRIFSEKSDVWAYGVVLWELATRGWRPYNAVESKDIELHVCFNKQRLPKAPVVSNCFYQLMAPCWAEQKSARPSFDLLAMEIEKIIEDRNSCLWSDEEYKFDYPTAPELELQNEFKRLLFIRSDTSQQIANDGETDKDDPKPGLTKDGNDSNMTGNSNAPLIPVYESPL